MSPIQTTLLLVIKDAQILLAQKKRGFGAGKFNGVGGKIEGGESIEQAMIRETQEETGITPTKYKRVAEILFDEYIKGKPEELLMHVYVATQYDGTPTESEEMRPAWFDVDKIPYDEMFPDDQYWLPYIINGKKIKAFFEFDKDFNLLSHKIEVVENI